MRLKNLPRLLSLSRYRRLQRDFSRPLQALLGASGLVAGEFALQTRDGEVLPTNRADRPLWEAYFKPGDCRVEIERGLFHVIPTDPDHPDYYIRGASGGFTWQPQRYVQVVPPVVNEFQQEEWSVYSQHGEDGVIQALLQRIPVQHRFVVEFGAYDGVYMSNSRYLVDKQDWNAFLIEADPRFYHQLEQLYRGHPQVTIKQSFITEQNINQLFREAGVPRDFEVLSIDVDGPDYYLWRALTDFEPRIVLVEYNSSIDAETEYVIPEDKVFEWGGTAREGASLLAFYNLGLAKGYQPIYSELYGANLFFVHRDIADRFNLEGITPGTLYQPPQFGELAGTAAPNGRGYR